MMHRKQEVSGQSCSEVETFVAGLFEGFGGDKLNSEFSVNCPHLYYLGIEYSPVLLYQMKAHKSTC